MSAPCVPPRASLCLLAKQFQRCEVANWLLYRVWCCEMRRESRACIQLRSQASCRAHESGKTPIVTTGTVDTPPLYRGGFSCVCSVRVPKKPPWDRQALHKGLTDPCTRGRQ
jgi:hypothetical protein